MATPPGLGVVGLFQPPARDCAGPSDWVGVPNLVRRLADAWHETGAAARRAILDEVWAEDGVYQDPYGDRVVGRDALSELMGYGVAPGQYIELRSWDPADMHHDAIRLAWRHCCPSGLPLLEGTDIATIGPDGRFSRVVSFWSRAVEEPAAGACEAGPGTSGQPSPRQTSVPTQGVCLGPDVDWSGLPPNAQAYGRAWNERDDAARLALLETAWAEHGAFADVYVEAPVIGREAVAAEIGGFLDAGFGAYFEPRPGVEGDSHHGFLRMPWTYCDANDDVVWIGEDIAELDADGRMAAVLSFFVP